VTTSAMRVLIAASWYPTFDAPGRGVFVADQATALSRAGIAVDVASWEAASMFGTYHAADDGGEARRAVADAWCETIRTRGSSVTPRSWGAPGIDTTRLPVAMPRVAGVRADPRAAAACAAEALLAWSAGPRFRSPAIIHAHVGLPDGVAAIALAERLGVPLVTTEHESTAAARLAQPGMRDAYLPLVAEGRRLLAVSQSLRDQLATALEVDPAQIGVVPNVVEVDAFEFASGAVGRDGRELLWVGARKENKGIDVLLAAFAHLRAARPDLRLRLIGRAPTEAEEARIQALARELGIAGAVAFEGQASRPEVAAAMARAAVFVHPSPTETFGVVAAEALATGLPVAATPSGGVEEVVGHDGRLGVIADDLGAEALAAAVARVLDDPTRFDALEMRASIVGRYGPGAVAGMLRDCYAELLARNAATPASVLGRPAGPEPAGPEPAGIQPAGLEPAGPAGPLVLILAMRRPLAVTSLAPVPGDLARSLLVVTAPARDGDAAALPAGPTWIEIDPDRAYMAARTSVSGRPGSRRLARRILRLVRNPLRPVRLRRLAARRPMLRARSLREDLATILAGSGTVSGVEIVALTADDADLVLPLLSDRVRLASGTLRGLVDHWDAAGRPIVQPPALAAPMALDAADS
jgi:glycosyltransferase involved in cell wall biosynthesis